jgi:hypothetical protein
MGRDLQSQLGHSLYGRPSRSQHRADPIHRNLMRSHRDRFVVPSHVEAGEETPVTRSNDRTASDMWPLPRPTHHCGFPRMSGR